MASPKKLHIICSLLMSVLFAYSATVQLNDHDWYFWLPLYSGACAVNLFNLLSSSKTIKSIAEADLCLGALLFLKVVIEDLVVNGISGIWSLDLIRKVIREKIGSGLVVVSMVLQLIIASNNNKKNKDNDSRLVDCGMVILVCFSYGLPFVFFVVKKGKMEF